MLLALFSTVLVTGAVTDKLVDFAVNVMGDLGLWGILVLMVPESACIPIPSEATMLFAGFNVAEGRYSLVAAVLVATVANLIGSLIAYAVGYYGRTELLEQHGRKLHIKPSQIAWADRWFAKYGDAAVFFSRMLPVIRTFISLPAGAARMPLWRFCALTFLGALPWNLALCLIGRSAGSRWTEWKDNLHYVDYAVVALVLIGIVYLAVRWRRNRGSGGAAPAVDAA